MPRPHRFAPPQPGRPLIRRSALVQRLHQRWALRVVVVRAGAGFGKTSLLAQALDENRLAPRGEDVWLGLDPSDADPRSLAEGLATALQVDLPQLNDPGDVAVAELATAIGDEVWRRSPRQVSLVLDDVHEVPAGSEAAQLLAALVEGLPANGHVVLAGRRDPPVPLARLQAQGAVGRIDERDLSFDDDELAAFADARDVPAERLAGLGGWPALAELRTAGTGVAIDDFLAEEVLADLPDDQRTAVATVAALGGADQALLEQVLDAPVDAGRVLSQLPLVSVDQDGWLTVHPLWSERLAGWLSRDDRIEARRRAGLALADRDVLSSLRLLMVAGADDEVRRGLRSACRAHHVPRSAEALSRLYRDLPASVQNTPEGELLAGVATAATDLDKGIHLLRSAAARFADEGELVGLLAAAEHLAMCGHWRSDPELLGELLDYIEPLSALPDSQGLLAIGRALLADTAGDAAGVLDAVGDLDPGDVVPYWRAPLSWLRGSAKLALGYPEAALREVRVAVAEAAPSLQGVLSMLEVNALAHSGATEEARVALERMLQRLEQVGNAHTLTIGLTQAANRMAVAGTAEEAEAYLSAAHRHAGPEPNPALRSYLEVAGAMVALARGEEAEAGDLLADALGGEPALEGRRRYGALRRLPQFYVLAPGTRTEFEDAPLGPPYRAALALARALVACREHDDLGPAARLRADEWREARIILPPAWRAELAAAALGGGRPSLDAVVDDLGPLARPALRVVADRAGAPRPMRNWARTLHDAIPRIPAAALEVGLLGPTILRREGRPVEHPHWRRERVRALLLLLITRGAGTREELSGALWPDLDAEAAIRNLRVTLSYLLAVLEPERTDGAPSCFVRAEGASLRLTGHEWLRIDAWEMDRLVDEATAAEQRGEPSLALELGRQAVALYRGPYLTDAGYEEWALPHRDRLNARFVAAAVRAGELTLAGGDPGEAMLLAARALEVEPWSEAAHRLAVAAHLSRGDRAAARRAMDTCLRQLDELGVPPTEDTEILLRAVGA